MGANTTNNQILILYPAGWVIEECCVMETAANQVPGSALLLAAYLRELGHDPYLRLVPANIGKNEIQPGLVVIYAPSLQFNRMIPLVQTAKQTWPQAATALVMYESTGEMELEAMSICPELDYAVLPNEKEISVGVLADYQAPRCPGGFGQNSGIVYRDEAGEPVSGGRRSFAKDMSHLPYSGHELAKFLNAHTHITFKSQSLIFQRGCPQGCTYCPLQHTRPRFRDPEVMAREIQTSFTAFGSAGLLTLEVFAQSGHLNRLLDFLLDSGLRCQGALGARCEYVRDLGLLHKIKDAGFSNLYFGIEGATRSMRQKLKKGFSDKQLFDALSLTNQAGLKANCSFITGLPWEDDGYYNEFVILIRNLLSLKYIARINLARLIPYPGLPISQDMIDLGIMTSMFGLKDFCFSGQKVMETCRHTLHLDTEHLEHWYNRLINLSTKKNQA